MSRVDSPSLRFSVVIPTHDTCSLTMACIESVLAAPPPGLDVVLVDDGSRDGTAEEVARRCPAVRILRNSRAAGFSGAANRGLSAATGEVLLLLNSDTELLPGAWKALDGAFRGDPRLGIAGAALRYPDGTPQWSGGPSPSLPWLFGLASGLPALLGRLPGARALRPVRGVSGEAVDWVTGAAMALRSEVWDEVGPLDEDFRFYCQDLDLCTRAGARGWRVAVVPELAVVHHHGATIGRRAGSAGSQKPDLLWADLVRWGMKHRGRSWARRAAWVLRVGAGLRLAARWLGGLFRTGAARRSWRRDSLAYRRGLAAVRQVARDPSFRDPTPVA